MKVEQLTDTIVLVRSEGDGPTLTTDLQSALDLLGVTWQVEGCTALVLLKEDIDESFFDLKTGLAGEVLQKFSNYRIRIGIVGDFSVYGSKSLRDFIYESNRGRVVCFADSVESAVAHLSRQ